MSGTAIALILAAAIAHASWNLLSKQASASGAAFFLWLMAACSAVLFLPVAIVATILADPHLAGLNWVFLAGTGVLHSGYFLFLQLGYRAGDLSLAYPIGRGTGATLAALAGVALLGERPGLLSVAGILAIIAGVVVIGGKADPVSFGALYFFPFARTLVGCVSGSLDARADFPRYFKHVRSGRLDLSRLVTGRGGLADIEAAFAEMTAGRGIRTLIEPGA